MPGRGPIRVLPWVALLAMFAGLQASHGQEKPRRTLGGNALQLLLGRGRSRTIEGLTQVPQSGEESTEERTDITNSTMMFMASHIASGRLDRADAMRRLSDLLIGQKATLVKQLRRNLQIKALMDIWLYFHVPLSFALLAALIAHIVSVFFYW